MRRVLLLSPAFASDMRARLKSQPGMAASIEATLDQLSADASHPSLRTHKLSGPLTGSWACSAGYELAHRVRVCAARGCGGDSAAGLGHARPGLLERLSLGFARRGGAVARSPDLATGPTEGLPGRAHAFGRPSVRPTAGSGDPRRRRRVRYSTVKRSNADNTCKEINVLSALERLTVERARRAGRGSPDPAVGRTEGLPNHASPPGRPSVGPVARSGDLAAATAAVQPKR